jgi:signal transduction histidine kinase
VWLVALVIQVRGKRTAAAEERATRLERDHDERARVAVAEERARIARELHDDVVHSVSVMTVQAGAARMMLQSAPDRAAEPLTAVEDAGRQALAELRRLLGILREDGAGPVTGQDPMLSPQPGLDDLPPLLVSVREAGLPVDLTVLGEPRSLPAGIELAAYRIVQEALTNTLKHAGPARARVTIRHAPDAVLLEITDDGDASTVAGEGHGIVGMHERVALYGGELRAGPLPGRGFGVQVRLPVDRVSR